MTVAIDREREVVVGRAVDEPDGNLHAARPDLPQQTRQIDFDLDAIAADRDALGDLGGARTIAPHRPRPELGLPGTRLPGDGIDDDKAGMC